MIQYVLNGGGPMGTLTRHRMDPGILRPWAEADKNGNLTGRCYVTMMRRTPDGRVATKQIVGPDGRPVVNDKGGQPVVRPVYYNQQIVANAPQLLRKEDWQRIDRAVSIAAKDRLRFWNDIYGANPYNVANGYGTISIQHAVADGTATATISMDPIRKGERSRPTMDVASIPLPVTHADGGFSSRQVAVSEGSGLELDTVSLTLAARAVGEETEKLALGVSPSYSYAGGTIYGPLNHPNRFTKVLTAPNGTNGVTLLTEFIDMVNTLKINQFYGPYVLYHSRAYNPWFGLDYNVNYAGSLRARLQEGIPEVGAWRELDYLTGSQVIIAQMTEDVIQGVQGMPVTTVQWNEEGGFEWNFKVLCIQIPRVRADGRGKLGIIHGSVP